MVSPSQGSEPQEAVLQPSFAGVRWGCRDRKMPGRKMWAEWKGHAWFGSLAQEGAECQVEGGKHRH